MDICRKLGVDSNTDLATRAATSVRYWVAHKSWRLRDHFKVIGIFPLKIPLVCVHEHADLVRYRPTI